MPNTYDARIIVTFPPDLVHEVEAYRHRYMIPSRAETIRRMLLRTILQDQSHQQPASQDVAA